MSQTPRARALGQQLRQHREQLRLSLVETAEAVGWSKAKVSRVERAEQAITEADVSALLVPLKVRGAEREQLLKMARELDQPVWWETKTGLPVVLTGLIDAEQRAESITEVATTLVPGLLQTRAYSRALFEDAEAPNIAEAIAVRQTRQDVLEKRNPVKYTAYIDETVLLRPVGGHETAAEQLRYLLAVGQRPNVTIRVLPLGLGVHRGLDGQFTVLHLPGDVVHVNAEASNAGFLLDKPDDVAPFMKTLELLAPKALAPEDSAGYVEFHANKHAREIESERRTRDQLEEVQP